MVTNYTYICVECCIANKGGGKCPKGHPMVNMGKRWRAPKQSNRKAWRRIAEGLIFWDRRRANKGRDSGSGRVIYLRQVSKGQRRYKWDRSTYDERHPLD